MSNNRHLRAAFDVTGVNDGQFQVHVRVSEEDSLDFSILLTYRIRATGAWIILRRYNGKAHEHRNELEEGPLFFDYHIHTATERYQRARGRKAESYAEITTRYVDWSGALACLVEDCGFFEEPDPQTYLFDGAE